MTIFFNFISNISLTGLVVTDDIAISLPFLNDGHSFGSVELTGITAAGPFHWYGQKNYAYAKIRNIATSAVLKVSDFTDGVTDIVGGTITLDI